MYLCVMEKYTNALIHESSPYLLQHAHNPVNWVAWSEDLYERAKREDKMLLISVGYSACHWCHVMEHECFEDEEVAALMNKFFINVKVDREERPDVDQVYMSAVQLMTQRGGWPLNCFTLPDGGPIYGGTYFPKEQWMHILKSLHHAFVNERPKLEKYAAELKKGVAVSELVEAKATYADFDDAKLEELVRRWSKNFDMNYGGTSSAPKFPLPSNYDFLLDYSVQTGNKEVGQFVHLTLDRMAKGGIYDQVGGGFSRYSVDLLWKVPHFEKMLYDNGQLIGLYANAYRDHPSREYKKVVYQTVEWLEREMLDVSGAFYAAMDADSEGVEGKFYTWEKSELKSILGVDYVWAEEVYTINPKGVWEEDRYILLRGSNQDKVQKENQWSEEELFQQLERINRKLLSARNSRVRPGLDDKCITGWNALLMKGLCEAFVVFEEERFLETALQIAHWIMREQSRDDGGLWRTYKNRKSSIPGFLEDYAQVISGFIALYQVTFDKKWLLEAQRLCTFAITHFGDETSHMFFFTPEGTELIVRKMELNDNVIPSSNSTMARNLFYLGMYFHQNDYIERARQMLLNVYDGMEMYGSGYSNWAVLLNHFVYGVYEFVFSGNDTDVKAFRQEAGKLPLSNVIFARTDEEQPLPIAEGKHANEPRIHVCTSGTCFAPTKDISVAASYVIQV